MQRRINDAQVERLLSAMRSSVAYRQELARRDATNKGLTPGTKEYKTSYNSAMRRFQRYITESEQKRSFARAPVEYQRETRRVAREVPIREFAAPKRPLPKPLTERPFDLRPPAPGPSRGFDDDEDDEEGDEDEDDGYQREYEGEIDLNDLRSVFGYFDGNLTETALALNLTKNETRLLDLAVSGQGLNVFGIRGGDELAGKVREWLETVDEDEFQDAQDFHDLLMNMSEDQVGALLDTLAQGETTLADWLDKWRDSDLDFDELLKNPEWWELWRDVVSP